MLKCIFEIFEIQFFHFQQRKNKNHAINLETEKEPEIKIFGFGTFQVKMQMTSFDNILLHMLFGGEKPCSNVTWKKSGALSSYSRNIKRFLDFILRKLKSETFVCVSESFCRFIFWISKYLRFNNVLWKKYIHYWYSNLKTLYMASPDKFLNL